VPRCLAFTIVLLVPALGSAQRVVPPAVDLSTAEIRAFLDNLPKDRVSDLPIRVVDAGGYRVGIYGVFRPKAQPGSAIRHDTTIAEIYYMLEGSGTLVTGGTLAEERSDGLSPNTGRPNFRGTRIEGGVSRRVGPGDVIVIPGRLNHWWSSLDGDLQYLIYRPDPESLQPLK
jgi:hypothetical protein